MKRIILITALLIGLYPILYFSVMNRSPAYDPRTMTAEYPSSFRWSSPAIERLNNFFPTSHWTNKLFAPLDYVFRRDDMKAQAEAAKRMDQNGRCYYDITNKAEQD